MTTTGQNSLPGKKKSSLMLMAKTRFLVENWITDRNKKKRTSLYKQTITRSFRIRTINTYIRLYDGGHSFKLKMFAPRKRTRDLCTRAVAFCCCCLWNTARFFSLFSLIRFSYQNTCSLNAQRLSLLSRTKVLRTFETAVVYNTNRPSIFKPPKFL